MIYLILFILFFVMFAPKKLLYYKLEHLLAQEQIIISDEKIHDGLLALLLQDGTLFVKDIDIGKFDEIAIYPDIFVNLVAIKNFRSNKTISLLPHIEIEKLFLLYSPLYPLKAIIRGKSNLGAIKGEVDLKNKRGFIDILSKKALPLKKVKEGQFRYEFSY